MQKENLFFFSFPSASNLFKVTNKRAKCKRKTCFSLSLAYVQRFWSSGVREFGSSDDTDNRKKNRKHSPSRNIVWTPEPPNSRTPSTCKRRPSVLSRFFKEFWLPKEVWRQISGRDLPILSSQIAKFLPEFCGQTWRDLQIIETQ